jgi:outer membrane protein
MRLLRRFGPRAVLATLLIPVLSVSAFGQAAPTAAQQPPAQAPPAEPGTRTPTPTIPPVVEQRANGPTVTLSVDDTVKRALEFNLDVQVERINPRLQDLTIAGVQSAWNPFVSNDTRYNSRSDIPRDTLLGSSFLSKTFTTSSQLQQSLPWYGTFYSVGWVNDRATSNALNQQFNPALSTTATFNLTQPLLQDFATDANRTQYRVSRKQREITDVALQQTIIQTTRQTQIAYWELFYARANLQVAQQSLDLARQTLRDNRTRVEVGTMAPIDIVRAEAEVARNEETAILAAAQIDQAEDTLRRLILDPQSPDYWTTNLDLSDAPPPLGTTDVDVETAVAVALQQRTDLVSQRKSIEATDLNIRYYKNQLLPQLDFVANYGFFGAGGFRPGSPADPDTGAPARDPLSISWGDIVSNAFGRDNPRWTVGMSFTYPLGRSNQEVTLVRSRLQYQQQQLGLKDAELQAANEVRTAGRNVNTNRRRVDAARSSRILSERQLEAEQKKFAVGLATSFEVVQAQRDLAQARNSELQAIVAYVESLVNFEASQKAGTSLGNASGPGGGGAGGTNNNNNAAQQTGNTGSRQQ